MRFLVDALRDAAWAHPGRLAVSLHDRALSYAELERDAGRVAAMVRDRGIAPGDRVGLVLPNVPEFASAYYGILRAGGVVVPMNPLLKPREVVYYLADSGAGLVLGGAEWEEPLRAAVAEVGAELVVVTDDGRWPPPVDDPGAPAARTPDDTAVILYTSGTTGRPKGAELTHANLAHNAEVSAALFGLTPSDVVFGGLPLFHSFGQTCAMNAAVIAGCALTLVSRFDPGEALAVLERDGVTVFEGVPTMYGALLHDPAAPTADLSALRICASGGASLPVELLHAFEAAFGCTIIEGYGLSETSPVVTFNRSATCRRPGSIGLPVDGVEVRVVDDADRPVAADEVGELVVRGANVMKGYWQRPDATAEAIRGGWFHTGDLARIDDDGFVFIVDRKKDLIIRGGYNVYPREVEEVLYEHPAVREAAVFGVDDARLGEEIAAAVVLKDGARCTAEELQRHVRDQLAPYKYPRGVWLLPELPKGPTGKILKRELRSAIASRVDAG